MKGLEQLAMIVAAYELLRWRLRSMRRRQTRRRRAPVRSSMTRTRPGVTGPPRITPEDLDLAYDEGVRMGVLKERRAQREFEEAANG